MRLFEDHHYHRYLKINLNLKVSVNGKFPSYNQSAHATYTFFENGMPR